ncbi:MAG: hypothetical protein ACYDHH_13355 [Solirubrobacteraceae bacterium]
MSTSPNAARLPAEWIANPDDERVHVPEGDPSLPWKETWYLSMRDEDSDQTVNMHMTLSANRTPPTRVGISVAHGGKIVTEVLRNDGIHEAERFGNELGRLEVVNLSSDSNHELRWSGNLTEVSFEIMVKGKHAAVFWDTMFAGFYPTGKEGHRYSHYEQLVEGEGWVRWGDGPRLPFRGTGWRDRGWGRRKTEQTFNTKIDLVGAVLPDDSVFSLISMRSNEIAADARMPVAGWRSDGDVLVPATSGLYHKDSMAWPAKLEIEFLDGYTVAARTIRRGPSIPCAWHDAEPEGSGFAHNLRDYYAVMQDAEGRPFTCFSNYGDVHKVDVLRDAEFMFQAPPPST